MRSDRHPHRAGRVAAWLAAAALTGASAVLCGAAPAGAAACDQIAVAVAADRPGWVLAALPGDLPGGRKLTMTAAADGGPFRSARPQAVAAGGLDVTIVLDSAAAMTSKASATASAAATGLVRRLPTGARVSLVTAGGKPLLVTPATRNPDLVLSALGRVQSRSGHALYDAMLLAGHGMSRDAARADVVVVIAGGPDDASQSTLQDASSLLSRQGALVSVLDVGRQPALPSLGAQCPGTATPTDAVQTGAQLAKLASGVVWVPVPGAVTGGFIQLHAQAGTSAARGEVGVAPAPAPALHDTSSSSLPLGLGVLAAALALGVLAFGAVLLAMWAVAGRDRVGPRRRLRFHTESREVTLRPRGSAAVHAARRDEGADAVGVAPVSPAPAAAARPVMAARVVRPAVAAPVTSAVATAPAARPVAATPAARPRRAAGRRQQEVIGPVVGRPRRRRRTAVVRRLVTAAPRPRPITVRPHLPHLPRRRSTATFPRKRRLHLPRLHLPRLHLPRLHLPRPHLPRLHLPRMRLHLPRPRLHLPVVRRHGPSRLGGLPRHRRRLLGPVPALFVRCLGLALLPALVVVRTLVDPQWWRGVTDDPSHLLPIGGALVLVAIGLRCLWLATAQPGVVDLRRARRLSRFDEDESRVVPYTRTVVFSVAGASGDATVAQPPTSQDDRVVTEAASSVSAPATPGPAAPTPVPAAPTPVPIVPTSLPAAPTVVPNESAAMVSADGPDAPADSGAHVRHGLRTGRRHAGRRRVPPFPTLPSLFLLAPAAILLFML